MNPSLKQKLKRIVKILSIIIVIVIIIISFQNVGYHVARRPSKIIIFKSQASSMQTALVAECDNPNPNPANIIWPSYNYNIDIKGSITTPLTCNTASEISGGAVTLDSKIGDCTATMKQTGVTFFGKDC